MALSAREAYEIGGVPQLTTGSIPLGPLTSYSLLKDPKHMSFVLARYKFVAKMLQGKGDTMEIGAGDGFGLPIVAQAVKSVHCADWEPKLVEDNRARLSPYIKNATFGVCDMTKGNPGQKFDAIYTVDVIEHLEPPTERVFFENMVGCLKPKGVMITGTPNVTAEKYASEESRVQHINLKSMQQLKELHERYFDYVFMFGQNDEVIHTGYAPMCHYIWAVAAGLKTPA
ncbi:MAG: class I SAM-dependent methyltransferase [Alphaproteobacteria bacterium]